jgi:enamine deaminase RidA (YjgF/YER057c/UK114 family)
MTLECINPPDLPTPETYTQVVIAKGAKLVFLAGQQPEGVDGKLVGRGDFAVQVRQTFTNLGRALAAGGARPEHVAKITIYVVDYRPGSPDHKACSSLQLLPGLELFARYSETNGA